MNIFYETLCELRFFEIMENLLIFISKENLDNSSKKFQILKINSIEILLNCLISASSNISKNSLKITLKATFYPKLKNKKITPC